MVRDRSLRVILRQVVVLVMGHGSAQHHSSTVVVVIKIQVLQGLVAKLVLMLGPWLMLHLLILKTIGFVVLRLLLIRWVHDLLTLTVNFVHESGVIIMTIILMVKSLCSFSNKMMLWLHSLISSSF